MPITIPYELIWKMKEREEIKLLELKRKLDLVEYEVLNKEEELINKLVQKYNVDKETLVAKRKITYDKAKINIKTEIRDINKTYNDEYINIEIGINSQIKRDKKIYYYTTDKEGKLRDDTWCYERDLKEIQEQNKKWERNFFIKNR